jgi:guanine deaminase
LDALDTPDLPAEPPFSIRARIVTPLGVGGSVDESDGLVEVDREGRVAWVGPASPRDPQTPAVDARPMLLLPGLIDLHAHLPQLPVAGTAGFGVRIMDWLPQVMHPVERGFDEDASRRLSPRYLREFARAGTTLACLYGSVDAGAMDAAFEAAEAHGIRVVMGQALMDRGRYDDAIPDDRVTEVRLREAAESCDRWDGRGDGRLRYCFTPRWALHCSREMLRGSAELAAERGAYWQTHIAEDPDEPAAVMAEFPEALDFLDVYERAGGLGPKAILAHAVHLNDRELARIGETRTTLVHCPASNVYLGGGIMPLARYRGLGLDVGLGSDVAGGFTPSMFGVMQVGAICQNARTIFLGDAEGDLGGRLDPFDWLRLASLNGARCLGLDATIGSIEAGKDADMILVDPAPTSPVPGEPLAAAFPDGRSTLARLIFRTHPDMVRAAWVRGRRLPGPAGWEPGGTA